MIRIRRYHPASLVLTVVLTVILTLDGCQDDNPTPPGGEPSIIYHNGNILTMDDDYSVVQAIAIQSGEIVATGTDSEVLALRDSGPADVIDLGGLTVMPGFIDSHAHWLSWPTDSCYASGMEFVRPRQPLPVIMDMLVANGWTGFSELAFAYPISWPAHIDSALALEEAGKLHLRVNGYWGSIHDINEVNEVIGHAPSVYSSKVKATGIKLYIDHPLGATCGDYTQEQVNELVQRAHELGYQIAAHAVNECGVEKILTAYELALGASSNENFRYRIEHAVKVNNDQMERMRQKGIIASVQLRGVADNPIQPSHMDHISNTNPEWQMRYREFIDLKPSGFKIVGSTDAPFNNTICDGNNPFRAIHEAVTREGYIPRGHENWELNQRITILEAIELMTKDAAYASFDEDRLGTLEPGKLADLIIVSANPLGFMSNPAGLLSIEVYLTMVGGSTEFVKQGHEGLRP